MNHPGFPAIRKSRWAAAIVGVGTMAAIDEILFHQILGWHHFYDKGTPDFALMTDGLLHAAELLAIVWGFFILLDLQRKRILAYREAKAYFFVGAGGFQLFDGIVIHKVLRLHQIRYVEQLLVYDIMWNLFGVMLLCVGYALSQRSLD